ncbi:CoA transferase subunit A [Saccharopolyspora sp. 5N102]|uniref:CoA transferase subunit A n=1 Tax=Saccharopolyspora sp. 5N102 TaxID=3375155 RepID=UPI0037A7C2F9
MTATTFREARADLERHARPVRDKTCTAAEALRFVEDGHHVGIGGTLYSRTPMALVFELLRQPHRGLTLSRPLTCYEAELLLVTGAADRIVTSWMGIGLNWGLSQVLRHYVERGLAVYEEWSHLGIGLRYKAGAMGVPYLPTLTMLGSDLARMDGTRTVECPYTGQRLLAVPALHPDVALIHVHRADVYGNAQVDGYRHMDVDMARAARRVVVSAEEIVDPDVIRASPFSTMLPHFAVDAVVEAPYGCYPHECYGRYEADTEHFDTYVQAIRDHGLDGVRQYIGEHVLGHPDFAGFLGDVGAARLDRQQRRAKELMYG